MSEMSSGVVYEIAYMAKDQWIELVGSRFEAKEGEAGEVCFDLYEHGGHWKSGLIVKGTQQSCVKIQEI
ncbi:unnamed protein product [Prunus armeniaca]|uniref:Uncharacterized protein n=1 Tax=Prunus armeniaca TaxID=36596 RepID=A0A6J5U956_PRUAR|nr:unnamed protein product [Prunus armeniaca]